MPKPADAKRAFLALLTSGWRLLRFRERPTLRTEPRVALHREAVLEIGAERREVALIDLAQGGALVEVPGSVLSRGQEVVLEIVGSRGEPLQLAAEIAARRGKRAYALRFGQLAETVRVDLVWDLYVAPDLDTSETVFSSVPVEDAGDEQRLDTA